MDAVTTLYGVKMIELAYRAKYVNGKKTKSKKANLLSYFLATDCVTTLPDIYPDGKRSSSKLINC